MTEDRVTVTLAVEKQGKTAEEVQKAINTQMQAAKKIYDAARDVKVSTGSYNVWQSVDAPPMPMTMDKNGKPVMSKPVVSWRGSQQVRLDAASGDAVLKLVADLQAAGLAVQGMDYYLSREASEKISDDLMVEALDTIGTRAQRLAKALGMAHVAYEEISSGEAGGGGYRAVPMMAKAAFAGDAAEAMPAPVGRAGETEVNITVNAKVRLTK